MLITLFIVLGEAQPLAHRAAIQLCLRQIWTWYCCYNHPITQLRPAFFKRSNGHHSSLNVLQSTTFPLLGTHKGKEQLSNKIGGDSFSRKVFCLLSVVHCLMPAVCCLVSHARCLLFSTRCPLCAVCYLCSNITILSTPVKPHNG